MVSDGAKPGPGRGIQHGRKTLTRTSKEGDSGNPTRGSLFAIGNGGIANQSPHFQIHRTPLLARPLFAIGEGGGGGETPQQQAQGDPWAGSIASAGSNRRQPPRHAGRLIRPSHPRPSHPSGPRDPSRQQTHSVCGKESKKPVIVIVRRSTKEAQGTPSCSACSIRPKTPPMRAQRRSCARACVRVCACVRVRARARARVCVRERP